MFVRRFDLVQALLSLPLILVLSWTIFKWEDFKIKLILKMFLKSKHTQLAIDKDDFILSNYNYVLFVNNEICSLSSRSVEYDVSDYRTLIAHKAKELYNKGLCLDMTEEINEEDCI